MEILHSMLEHTQFPFITAFVLGLMTSISPCPLATNITAIAFIGKNIENKRTVFFNGLIYTLGRIISYTSLGLLFYFGASRFHISWFFQNWGEKILGPLLVIIGLVMLDVIRIKWPWLDRLTEKMEENSRSGIGGMLLLGAVFALAFCPYSGALYFGMLIPMTISTASGLYLPMVFAIATGLPVILFAWLIAYMIGEVGIFYNKVKTFEIWFRRVVSLVFVVVGLYYISIFFIQ